MLDARRLPTAVVVATFVLCASVAGTGVGAVALGAGSSSDAACSGIDDDRPARGILDCLAPSAVYVETALGSGSGLVIADGYVVTNAHVVDPFDAVDLTIGEEEHEAVPVVGVDLFADIAVVGPVDTEAPGVELSDPAKLVQGDDLFLVGYPGEISSDDLEPSVASGILSRQRDATPFDLQYLQTDASIGGGQSGGALADVTGRVVGISSLRFAENFALALTGTDAAAAVERILAGDGSDYVPWPGGDAVTEATVPLEGEIPTTLAFPASDEDRLIDVTIPQEAPVLLVASDAFSPGSDPQVGGNVDLVVAQVAGVSVQQVRRSGVDPYEFVADEVPGGELAERVAPGVFRFELPADTHIAIGVLSPGGAGSLDVAVRATAVFAPRPLAEPVELALGDEVVGIVDRLSIFDTYRVHLDPGQAIEIDARTPASDIMVSVTAPGEAIEESEFFDDSEEGLYGLDVKETYTADHGGVHEIRVGLADDGPATGYRLSVTEAG